MFKRPEELIVLILAVLWIVLTYFLAAYTGAAAYTVLLISVLTAVWAVVCFFLWQRGLSRLIWPLFLGALVACWWPWLDWYAVKDFIAPGAESQAIVVAKPWYAGWTFKIILAAIPVALGYAFKWKRARQTKISINSSF
ncbi:hypothetical protein [Neisseria perflava]|uniref:hypothetical protein n=1 Tax=Neisseria perflava TaxID=33053 RepID=UPI00209DDD2D|nr:hypothetical protein [Neisseria perflava]MCP1660222.1 hypothetical protein [Neisseria perflava]MCP1771831.1 hypothetical protein [Neisseria perflava]